MRYVQSFSICKSIRCCIAPSWAC